MFLCLKFVQYVIDDGLQVCVGEICFGIVIGGKGGMYVFFEICYFGQQCVYIIYWIVYFGVVVIYQQFVCYQV